MDLAEKKEQLEKAKAELDALVNSEPDLQPPKLEPEITTGLNQFIPGCGCLLISFYQFSKTGATHRLLAIALLVLGVIALIGPIMQKEKIKLSSQISKENKRKVDEFNEQFLARQERIEAIRPRVEELRDLIARLEEELDETAAETAPDEE